MTRDAEHQEVRSLLGAYLLGGLDSADRDRYESHLTGCKSCEEEMARLAPVPGLLGRLREPAPTGVRPPPAELVTRLLDETIHERRRIQRRSVLATLAVAAALLVAVVAAGTLLSGPDEPAPTTLTLQAAGDHEAAGSASLTAKAWGTEMTLQLDKMPTRGPFVLEITDEDGASQVAATWGTTPTGVAVVSGATALPTDTVSVVRVLGPEGTVLEGRVDPASP